MHSTSIATPVYSAVGLPIRCAKVALRRTPEYDARGTKFR
jgi:hypothetical protein